jgi:hypothetical protein
VIATFEVVSTKNDGDVKRKRYSTSNDALAAFSTACNGSRMMQVELLQVGADGDVVVRRFTRR